VLPRGSGIFQDKTGSCDDCDSDAEKAPSGASCTESAPELINVQRDTRRDDLGGSAGKLWGAGRSPDHELRYDLPMFRFEWNMLRRTMGSSFENLRSDRAQLLKGLVHS
jgi:hypothetical protein